MTSVFYQVRATNPVTPGSSSLAMVLANAATNVAFAQTSAEAAASVTPADTAYLPGDVKRYSTLQNAIDASEGNVLTLDDTTRTIATSGLVANKTIIIQGVSSAAIALSNVTDNIPAITFDGNTTRLDRARVRELKIDHQASSKYAIHFDDSPYAELDNVYITCGGAGFGGVHFGDALTTPTSNSFFGSARNLKVENFTGVGVRVNSTGTLWLFDHCEVRTTVNNAVAGLFESEGVRVIGGQWGSTGSGGSEIGLHDYNATSSDRSGSIFDGQVFSGMSGQCVVFNGNSNVIDRGVAKNQYADFSSVTGTLCFFGRAEQCRLEGPIIKNPTASSGGTLANWGEHSKDCVVVCDYIAAQAPITVHGSATRAVKIVTGQIARTQVAAITTNANLTTTLQDGVTELPSGFIPVHNGTAWNYHMEALADDAVATITPPSQMGILTVLNDDEVSTFGIVAYDCRSGGAVTAEYSASADLEVSTGIKAGTTGTNDKITVSAHTNGRIYVECRKGASNITVLFQPAIYGV